MRLRFLVLGLPLLALACGDGSSPVFPGSPSPISPAPPAPPPQPEPWWPADIHQIELGEVVISHLSPDDPVCGFQPCRYYGVTVPSEGSLRVELVWNPLAGGSAFDLAVYDPNGSEFYPQFPWPGLGGRRVVDVPARAGVTYVIHIASSTPGERFELRTSFERQ